MALDLTDAERRALTELRKRRIEADRFPLSPRVQLWKGILAEVRPEPEREPLLPPKTPASARASARPRH